MSALSETEIDSLRRSESWRKSYYFFDTGRTGTFRLFFREAFSEELNHTVNWKWFCDLSGGIYNREPGYLFLFDQKTLSRDITNNDVEFYRNYLCLLPSLASFIFDLQSFRPGIFPKDFMNKMFDYLPSRFGSSDP